jgi:hypothetical protein
MENAVAAIIILSILLALVCTYLYLDMAEAFTQPKVNVSGGGYFKSFLG